MARLTLKYERNVLQSLSGTAWIMIGQHKASRDCSTAQDLDHAIDGLQGDLELIRQQGRLAFAAHRKAEIDKWSHARRP
jgi:hypothetical protein